MMLQKFYLKFLNFNNSNKIYQIIKRALLIDSPISKVKFLLFLSDPIGEAGFVTAPCFFGSCLNLAIMENPIQVKEHTETTTHNPITNNITYLQVSSPLCLAEVAYLYLLLRSFPLLSVYIVSYNFCSISVDDSCALEL